MQEHHLQSVGGLLTRCSRAAGVLKYNLESDNPTLELRSILPESQHLTESPVKCEYCGEIPKPSLDLTWAEDPETVTLFCCGQHQQLCAMLLHQRRLLLAGCALGIGTPIPVDNTPTTELEELLLQGRELKEYSPLLPIKPEQGSIYMEMSTHPPVADTSSKISYQLSACAPGNGGWTVFPSAEDCMKTKETEVVSVCDHEPLHFGISHHQEGASLLHKYYANGMKFLILFPDGSAQVFYPSGLLALVVIVTEGKGRACIVHDDSHAPEQPIRAVFQSSGRATCYHSNGIIWLSLNRSGGQCLDETGARLRRWSWSGPGLVPTPLQPVFLSLNRCIGVRVLGEQQVFLSFLACGQQAKFSLGACCVKGDCRRDKPASGPSITKEELFLLAGKIRVHQAFKRLHQCLRTPSNLRPLKATRVHCLGIRIQRLLEVSDITEMSETERAFIHRCLKDCL